MNEKSEGLGRVGVRLGRVSGALVLVPLFVGVILLAGIGLAAVVAPHGTPRWWVTLGNVGQTFGVLTAVLSAGALTAMVITFRYQLGELREQRTELARHGDVVAEARDVLATSGKELYRAAEALRRMAHIELMKLALADSELADVWPSFAEVPPDRRRQYHYANLIIQGVLLEAQVAGLDPAEVESRLRYLFTSPRIREYWRRTRQTRREALGNAASAEYVFAELADRIWQEYESVVACAGTRSARRPPRPRRQHRRVTPEDTKAA